MAIRTIIVIVLFAVAAVLFLVVIGVVLRQRRTAHRRVRVGDIRVGAAEQSHTVGRHEALADRDDVRKEFERADTIDPDSQTQNAPGQDTATRETPPGTPGDTRGPRPTRRAG